MIIGIDLGTTNSVAAYYGAEGPKLIANALGDVLTPSVVGIDFDNNLLVGRTAKELQVVHPDRCAALFKRHMGTDWTCKLNGRKFSAVELSSLVLQSLKADAEAHLQQPVTQAVITVPAYFNESQRRDTMQAGRIAGLTVERILNEPTAAAIAYGVHENDQEKVALIFDLGGGTFDVSIIDQFEGALEIRASSGETFLGGEDFTNTLAARVLETQGYVFERAELEHPKLVSRLRKACELAKRRLSQHDTATIRIPDRAGEFPPEGPHVAVSRSEFEKWTQQILARAENPIRRVLGDARLTRGDINEVILVGGATRMRAVSDLVKRLFDREPRQALNPDEVVALGAAVQAGLVARNEQLEELVVTDVAPFTLGIEITRRVGGQNRQGYFLPVITRNTTIPVSRVERVETLAPNQSQITVKLFQGESRQVKGNLPLGEFTVSGIPAGPAGQEIDIRFTYDLNGVLEVEATVVATGRSVTHLVTRYAKGLTDKQIREAVKLMQTLKTHPRDETQNRFLLRRAERLYAELPLFAREELDVLLTGFEGALEYQDAELIERHRDALEAFLNRFDGEWNDDTQTHYPEAW